MVVDIKELEDILAKSSYLNGSVPSKHDFEMFEQLSYPDVKHSQHLLRWYTNIGNFTIEERMYLISDSKDSEKEEEKDRNDEDFDVFGEDDDEDLERRAKLAQHNIDEKKKKAGKVDIQKSMCILEVKPYDDETDLVELGKKVRACTRDGLVWGEVKLVPVFDKLKKLQIGFTIEDDKVPSTEIIEEEIGDFEEVQSADVTSINKLS